MDAALRYGWDPFVISPQKNGDLNRYGYHKKNYKSSRINCSFMF
jgi:hypothetical protein